MCLLPCRHVKRIARAVPEDKVCYASVHACCHRSFSRTWPQWDALFEASTDFQNTEHSLNILQEIVRVMKPGGAFQVCLVSFTPYSYTHTHGTLSSSKKSSPFRESRSTRRTQNQWTFRQGPRRPGPARPSSSCLNRHTRPQTRPFPRPRGPVASLFFRMCTLLPALL